MSLYLLSLNHQHAPIALREKAQIDHDQLAMAYQHLLNGPAVEEAMLYSTCERTEILWLGKADAGLKWLANFHGISLDVIDEHTVLLQDQWAIAHAIEVATGLQSSLLGEPQILGQFKTAFKQAQKHHALKTHLERVVSNVIAMAKKLRTQYPIGVGTTTPASLIVHLSQTIFSTPRTCRWLCVGSGEVIQQCMPYIEANSNATITVLSRQPDTPRAWASKNINFVHIAQLPHMLLDTDIVVSATRHPLPLIGKGLLERTMKQRRYQPLLMADMAVPRNIEPECQNLSGVYLYDLDALHKRIDTHQNKRAQIKEQLLPMMEACAKQCLQDLRVLSAKETISTYRRYIESQCQEVRRELQPMLKEDPDALAHVDQLLHQMIQKILHHPTQQLRKAARDEDHTLLHSLQQLLTFEDKPS